MMNSGLLRLAVAVTATFAIRGQVDALAAQSSALASATVTGQPVIEYLTNESGGRIRISVTTPDSGAIEAVRLGLLENAAAIRRGDFHSVRIIRIDLPAVQVLARLRAAIRCTVRLHARGGELVLLSDEDAVVAAIHQLLAAEPPQPIRL